MAANPILHDLKKLMKNPNQMDQEYFTCMLDPVIYDTIDVIM